MIFLDNCSTTKPRFFRSNYEDFWMNSNTPYARTKEQLELEKAKEKIKSCLGVKGGYVLFFRCASEAVEWLFNKVQLMDMICSPYEHDSVFNLADTIDVGRLDSIKYRMLYCHQLVNQITGDTWDIHNIAQCLRPSEFHPQHFLGMDLTAAIGHVILPNDFEDYCDALWFSGHKFYTEKGIGAMWISDRLGQYLGASKDPKNQYNLVHGTVDVQGACMLADAMEWISGNYEDNLYNNLLTVLYNFLFRANIEAHNICLNEKTRSHAINAIYLPNINADALQTYLASKDIYIGVAHSACSGESDYRVLEAMGYNKTVASQTIRVSFSVDTTVDDINSLANEVKIFKEMF